MNFFKVVQNKKKSGNHSIKSDIIRDRVGQGRVGKLGKVGTMFKCGVLKSSWVYGHPSPFIVAHPAILFYSYKFKLYFLAKKGGLNSDSPSKNVLHGTVTLVGTFMCQVPTVAKKEKNPLLNV